MLRNIYTGMRADALSKLLQKRPCHLIVTNVAIIFSDDNSSLKQLYTILNDLPRATSFKFFFILPSNAFESGHLIEDVARFFFLPNYLQDNNIPVLAFKEKPTQEKIAQLRLWYHRQGFNKPDFKTIYRFKTELPEVGQIPFIPSAEKDNFFSLLLSNPNTLECLLRPVLIDVSDLHELDQLVRCLFDFEISLKKDYPGIYNLLLNTAELETDRRNNQATIAFLQTEVSNLKLYNKELQSTNEVQHILDFYRTQYEVLPLWYKRFGHVIKIMTGKRKVSFTTNWRKR